MTATAGMCSALLSQGGFLLFLFLFHIFCFKKVGRMAERLEKLQIEMEGPEKQKMAEMGKQKGSPYSLSFLKGLQSWLCNWRGCR